MKVKIIGHLKMCKIVLRFTYRNHLNELSEHACEFLSIEDFKNYLRWVPERAMLIGYGKINEDVIKISRSSNVRLSIVFRDQVKEEEITFNNAASFGQFLRQYNVFARKVGLAIKKP